MRAWARVVLAATLGACAGEGAAPLPPLGEVVLHVDTDAPLPDAGPGTVPALFDRMRVALLPPGAASPCDGCTQEFELTTPLFANLDASVGLQLPPGQSGWLAHVQMFPLAFAASTGEPDPATTVDVTVSLPVLAETGVVDVTVMLSTADVGQPAASPRAPIDGAPVASQVGTWGPATRKACQGTAQPDEVCVPGGAFWMGTPRLVNPALPGNAFLRPRLVTISPYFLGATEVTVGAYRKFGTVAHRWSGSDDGVSSLDWCTFTTAPGTNDVQPINCITWTEARAYCRSRGGDLPTEAQWEYAAGGLTGSTFVWGSDLPRCGDAVWGRAGVGYFAAFAPACPPGAPPGEAPAPVNGGRGRALDALQLDGGTIYDLAGNLAEWTVDTWDAPDGPCWGAAHVYADPVCNLPDGTGFRAVRGAHWYDDGNSLPAVTRVQIPTYGYADSDGFRCARPDAP